MVNPVYGGNIADTAIDRARGFGRGRFDGEILTADKAINKNELNRTYLLNSAGGIAITLPAISASDAGMWIKVIVMTTVTATDEYSITAASGDLLEGYIFLTKAADWVAGMAYFDADESNDLIITMDASTTGGLVGGWVFMQVNDNGYWTVEGLLPGSGTLATPFS